MSNTARWGLPYPAGTDLPDVPQWMHDLAVSLDDHAKDTQGTLANRPTSSGGSPGKYGRYYFVTGDPDSTQNGRLYRDNGAGWDEIQVGPIAKADLATDALNNFLKLNSAADRKIAWGTVDSKNGNSWGIAPSIYASVPHHLGSTPQAVWGNFDLGVSTSDSNDPAIWSWQDTPWDATNFNWRIFTRSGGNCNYPGYTFHFVAIL